MKKHKYYWTILRCKKEAKKFKKRSDFKKNAGGAYNFALKQKILDKICFHMKPVGNRFKRLVYTYEFQDKTIYVGLTYDINERTQKHKIDKKSAVYKYIQKTGLNPKLTYTGYMSVLNAIKLEQKTVDNYRSNNYTILNIAKPGAVGGENIKWNFEKCKNEALKYKSKTEFAKKSNSAYNAARRYKWIKKICSHMIMLRKQKPIGYWTIEKCKNVASKSKTRQQFYKKYSGAYMACLRNKWLNEVCAHMLNKVKMPNNYWTLERCSNEALKYDTKTEFQKGSGGSYRASLKNGWLVIICEHMKK